MQLEWSEMRRCLAAAALACTCVGAGAVPIVPGGAAVALPGTTAAAQPSLAGVVLADVISNWESAIDPMYGFPGATGQLVSRVVRSTLTGTLDFYWQILVSPPSYPSFVPQTLTIANLSLASFLTGAAFDADYRTDGLGTTAPTGAFAPDASSLVFTFSPNSFGPGSSSYLLLVHSNATAYDSSATAGLGVSQITTFAPVTNVPEPETYALLLLGLATGGAFTRRRRAMA